MEAEITEPLAGRPPQVAADPAASRLDWEHDIRPKADIAVPPGHLAIRVQNAQRTSAGVCVPGQVIALPDAEARELLRQGLGREAWVIQP